MNSAIIAVMTMVAVPAWGSQFDDDMHKCDTEPTTAYKQCVDRAYAERKQLDASIQRFDQELAESKKQAWAAALKDGLSQAQVDKCRAGNGRGWDTCVKDMKDANRPYPKIGMTKAQVIATGSRRRSSGTWGTSWDAPDDVNTTVTAAGTSEQWVYSGNRYLYFTNDVLTAIQE